MAAEAYNFFEGSQTDINRRFLRKIEALEKALENAEATGFDDSDLKQEIADLKARVKALEDAG